MYLLYFKQEDYYKDPNSDGIPIRWMAPECMEFTSDNKLKITKFTKEANIWYVFLYAILLVFLSENIYIDQKPCSI